MQISSSSSQGQCAKCGALNDYTSLACSACGARLPWAGAVSPSQARTQPLTQPLSKQNPSPLQIPALSHEWHYTFNGNRVGPIDQQAAQRLISSGSIKRDTMVWRQGMKDWQEAETTELSSLFASHSTPPPMRGEDVNNTLIWVLAFAPIIGLFLQGILAGATQSAIGNFWLATLILNAALCLADEAQLKKAGHDTKGMTVWAFLLVPVYLFVRASRLKQKNAYAWVWVVMFVISLGASGDSLFGPDQESIKTTVLTSINENAQKNGANIKCTSVTLVKESEHKYTGIAEFDDGTKLPIEVTAGDDGTVIWRSKLLG